MRISDWSSDVCSSDLVSAKSASLLAALAQTPEHLASTRLWYRQRIAGLDLSTPGGRHARLAFLATEGAFMLRFFGFMDIDEAEWQAILVGRASCRARVCQSV